MPVVHDNIETFTAFQFFVNQAQKSPSTALLYIYSTGCCHIYTGREKIPCSKRVINVDSM